MPVLINRLNSALAQRSRAVRCKARAVSVNRARSVKGGLRHRLYLGSNAPVMARELPNVIFCALERLRDDVPATVEARVTSRFCKKRAAKALGARERNWTTLFMRQFCCRTRLAWRLLNKGRRNEAPRSPEMLYYAVVFLIIALIAALFGFTGIAAGAAGIAKILFVVFLIIAAITFVLSVVRGR
jgi:uncharacterized membrane protein YtjA (UPF0391 family)